MFTLPSCDVHDKIGGNDAFIGAFLSQVIDAEHWSAEVIQNAISAAHWAKREVLQWIGAQFPKRCGYYAWRKGQKDYSYRCQG